MSHHLQFFIAHTVMLNFNKVLPEFETDQKSATRFNRQSNKFQKKFVPQFGLLPLLIGDMNAQSFQYHIFSLGLNLVLFSLVSLL